MSVTRRFWQWLRERQPQPNRSDPLAPFATLTVQRLEERRVLSVSVGVSGGDVTVDVTGDDTVTFEVNGTDLVITDVNDVVIDTITMGSITSLTVNADEGNQQVEFVGMDPFAIPTLTINSTSVNGDTGTDNVTFSQDFNATGAIAIDVTGSVTVDAGVAITSANGEIAIDAGGNVTMDAGSSIEATNLSITIDAGSDITVQDLTAGVDIDLSAGGMLTVDDALTATTGGVTLDGTGVDVNASITSDGTVSIIAANDVMFSAAGYITVADGDLSINAGNDLTMADGTTFDVTSATGASVSLTAGSDVAVSQIAGANLDDVTITAGGSISDALAAETANVTADTLALTAGTGIGVGDDFDTEVTNLEALTTTGGIVISEASGLTIGGVTGSLNGVDVATAGGIAITAGGSIVVTEGVSGPGHISLSATGSTSDLTVSIGSGVSSAGGDITLAADRTVTISENVGTTGAGTLTVTGNGGAGARNIVVNSGAVVSVVDGDLRLDADQGIAVAGNFVGIRIDNATVQTTGTGNVTLVGRGGDDAGTAGHHGILITNGAVVQSTATGLADGEGEITLIGTGGASDGSNNSGVAITGAGTMITSVDGDIAITGVGGAGSATSGGNFGIQLTSGAQILSTGVTPNAATITLDGTGGAGGGGSNFGVRITSSGTQIASAYGDILITGQGGGSGASANNHGIALSDGARVLSTGTGADAATITLDGTGGNTTGSNNYGVLMVNAGTLVTSVDGNISITGTGGGTGTSGLGFGIFVSNGAQITSTGAGPEAATITLDGTGGSGSGSYNIGVYFAGTGAVISSVDGDILIFGQGGGSGTGGFNSGIYISGTAQITSTGTADITLMGAGSNSGTGGQNHGVIIADAGTQVTATGGGDIHITGIQGADPSSLGIVIGAGAVVSTGGSGDIALTADRISINGTASIDAGSRTVTIQTATAGTTINLGGADFSGSLGLTDAELDTITAGTLVIGNATSGAITVSGAITIDSASVATLCLITASTVTTTTGSLAVQNLSVSAGGSVQFTTAGNDADKLAITTTTGNVVFVDMDELTIASVNAIDGVTTGNGNITLTASAGSLTLGDGGGQDITATGTVTLQASAGITDAAGSIITAAALELLGSGDVVLDNGHQIDTLAADLDGSLTFVNAQNFTVGTAGATTGIALGPSVGRNLSLTATGGVITLAADVATTGSQDFESAVEIADDLTLTSSGSGDITFDSTVEDDGLGGTASNLVINTAGITTFSSTVGGVGAAALSSLTTDATGSTVLSGNVVTTGGQSFGDAVTLAADVTLTSTGNGDIAFGSTIDGDGVLDRALTVTTGGTTTVGDDVGSLAALASLTVDGGGATELGGDVDTVGSQSWSDDVLLLADVALTTNTGHVTFDGTIESDGSARNLTVASTSGNVVFNDTVGVLNPLGDVQINTSGDVELNAAFVSAGNIDITGNAVTVVDVDTTSAATGGLTITHAGLLSLGNASLAGSFVEDGTGNVLFDGTVSSANGDITFNNDLDVASGAVQTDGGNITFVGAVDGAGFGSQTLSVTSNTGDIAFQAAVGDNDPLAGLTTDTAGLTTFGGTVNVAGTLAVNQTVGTPGDVDFQAAVTVDGDLLVDGNNITAADALDAGGAITLHAAQAIALSGDASAVGAVAIIGDNGTVQTQNVTSTANAVNLAANQSLTVAGTVNAATTADLSSTNASVDVAGQLVAGGMLTVSAATDVTIGDVAGVSVDAAAVSIVADAGNGGTVDISGSVTAATAAINIVADAALLISGNVTAATSVTLESRTQTVSLTGEVEGTAASVEIAASTGIGVTGDVTAGTFVDIQTNTGDVQLGANVTASGGDLFLESTAGNVEVQGALDASAMVEIVSGGTVDLHGTTTAGADVLIDNGGLLTIHLGANVDAGGMFVQSGAGNVELCANITADDAVQFASNLLLTADVTIDSATGGVTLDGTVDADGTNLGGESLTILAGDGAVSFGADVGGTTALEFLTVTTSGGIDALGNITADGDVSLDSTAADIAVTGFITSNAGGIALTGELGVSVTGNVSAATNVDVQSASGSANIVGDVTAGTSLTITAGAAIDVTGSLSAGTTLDVMAGAGVVVTGDVTAVDAVAIAATNGGIDVGGNVTSSNASVSLTSLAGAAPIHIGGDVLADTFVDICSASGAVDLDQSVTATNGNVLLSGQSLTADGAITAGNGVVITTVNGATLAAAAEVCAGAGGISVTGDLDTAANLLADGGAIVIDGSLTLSNSITIDSDRNDTGGADITVTGTVDIGAFTLTLDASLTGDITLLMDLSGSGDLIVEEGDEQSYAGLTLGNLTISDAMTSVTFTGPIDATGDVFVCSQGTIDVQSTLMAGGTVTLKAAGGTMLCNDLTVATIMFDTAVVLCGDVTITATGAVTFESTVDSESGTDWSLTVDAAGITEFQGEVGGIDDLGSLTTTGGNVTVLHADVTTTGEQHFGDAVQLMANLTLTATDTDANGEGIEFGSTVAGNGFDLTIAGGASFAAAVSGVDVFLADHIDTESTFAAGQVTVTGTADLGGDVTTTGTQTYTGAVTLTADVTLESAGNQAIAFGSTVDSDDPGTPRTLTVTTAGTTTFGDDVGSMFALRTLTVDGGGVTELGGSVSTTQTQDYLDALELTADVVLSSSGAGGLGNITFDATVDGPHSLTVNTAGTTQFNDRVGDMTALTTLHTDAAGTTVLNTDVVIANVVQFDDPVLIDVTTTVTGTTSVEFGQSVAGVDGDESLTVVTGGDATFGGTVTNLVDVTVNAAGTTTFAGDVAISGALLTDAAGLTKLDTASMTAVTVTFHDAVELCQDLAITADEVTFGSTLDEAIAATGSNLALSATGDILFSAAVGGTRALDSLTITTADDVTFAGTVRLDGTLEQQAGTGTTAFHGTSGTGIGGDLLITTDTVTFSTADVVTVGAVVITAANAITFNANAGLNAGGSTIALRANQDGSGSEGLTQTDGTVIQTTNDTAGAVLIEVGGTGSAAISDVRAGTTGGVVTITVGGAITDNSLAEMANITAAGVALTAVSGIGSVGTADLDTAASNLDAVTATGGITIEEADAVTIGGVTGALGGLDVLIGGDIQLTAGGSIAVTEQITGPDDITLLAVGAASDLTIAAGSGVVSTDGNVVLSADRTVTISENVSTAAAGSITVTGNAGGGARNIVVDSAAVVSVVDGNLTLDADQGAQQSGDFAGVLIDNATLQSTGSGDIVIAGRGGNDASGGQAGVAIINNATVQAAATGTVTITGFGGTSTGNDSAGVLIDAATVMAMEGNVVLTGTATDATGTGHHGIQIQNDGAIVATGAAHITLTGAAASANPAVGVGIDLAAAGTATVSTAAGTGDIRLVADSMSFGAGADINAGANVVTLVQRTNGTQVNLGGADAVGVLGLTDAELDTITAGELRVGDANTGAVTVSADVNLTNNTPILCLQSAASVTATAGGLAVANLAVTAGGTVTLTDPQMDVDNVAIATTLGNVTFTDADGFTVTTVCGVQGVSTASGSVNLTATTGDVTITDTTATADVSATTGITIALLANDALFTIASGANVQTAAGGVSISADKMDLGGTITAVGQRVTLKNSVGGDAIDLGSATDAAADTLELSDAELDRITCGTLEIGSATMGPITVTDDLFLTNNAAVLHLVTGSSVTATAGGIVIDSLAVTAGGAVTFTDATTNVTSLAIDTSTGNVLFTEANGLTITTVDGVRGIDTDSGSVTVIVTLGDLTVANTAAASDIDATAGIALSLLANDALFTISTGADVETIAGGVAVSADKMNLAGSITAVGQTVTLHNSVGVDAVNLGSTTDAAANTLELSDAELNRITSNLLVIGSATTGQITVSADLFLTNNASLLRLETAAGVTATAGGVVVSNLVIDAGGTVHFTDGTTDVNTLAVVTTAGSVTFTDLDNLTVGTVDGVAGITTAGGDVTLTTNGQLTLGSGLGEDITAAGATVCIMTGSGGMTEQAGSVITAANLYLTGAGSFTLAEANDINVLAAQLTGAASSLTFNDVDELTIGTVCGFAGIATNGGNVTLATGGLLTLGTGAGQDIAAGNAIVTLDTAAGGVTELAGSVITAGSLRLLGSGVYTLNQQNDVTTFAADVDGTVAYTDANALAVGTVAGTVGITTVDGDVKLTTGGHLAINDDVSLGVADLTLNVTGNVTQTAGDTIVARGLQLLGTGTVTLNEANDVDLLASSYNGTIAFTDVDDLTVGSVTDDPSGMTTVGITTSSDDVKLATGGNLAINDDIALGVADLTLNVTGAITQTAGDTIAARGLQLLGTGSVTLNEANDVDLLAASYNGTIAFTDADDLTIGTVTDNPSGMTAAGITTSNDSVTIATGGLITIGTGAGQDIAVGNAVVTLNAATGGVLENAGSVITADQLLLTGTGTFTLAQGNDVNTLAADLAGSLTFVDVDDLIIGTVAATNGISTGNPTAGGDVTITATGDLTVNQAINTQGGAGGVVTVTGGTLNAALIAGAGNITLTGGNQDLVINANQTAATTLTYQANRDVIINATVTTTGAGADVIVTADLDSDGSGGVQVTANGQVVSADAIVLSGSDLFATAGSLDSIRIDADGASDQLLAAGNITLQNRTAAPAGADIVIDGRVHSTAGNIAINALDTIRVQSVIAADNGSVTFQDAVVLTGDLLVTAGGTVTFQSTVNDDGLGGTTSNLTVTASGATTFQSHVGNLAAISSLTSDGGNNTNLCGNVTTVNGQTYADAVVLCAGTVTLTSTAAGAVTFQSTVDSDAVGPRNLVVNTAGVTDFQGAVGGTRALATLTTDVGGSTQIGGGLIRTTGTQTYNDNVLLTNDALLESVAASANGADITVAGTLQTGGFNLTFDAGTQGDLTLQSAASGGGTLTVLRGDVQQFAAVTVDEFVIQSATTSVTFHDAVNVTNNVAVTSGGTITQESTVDAGSDVAYTAAGAIAVQGALTAGSDVTLTSMAASITSTAAMTATTGHLIITAATTYSATGALTAATSVVITTTNGTTLSATADVCTTASGGFVTITGPLTTAADILTNDGAITLTGPVLLTGSVVWDSNRFGTGGADVVVQGTVATGGFNLTVDAGPAGDLTFQSTVTGGGDLTVEDGDTIRFEAAVQVTNLTVQDATTSVTLVAPVTVTSDISVTSGGSVTLQDTLTAGDDIAVMAGTTLSATQSLTAADQIALSAGTVMTLAETADLVAGTGGVMLAAPQIMTAAEITTTSGDVALTGAVTLTGDVTIDTGLSGNVLVTGTINAQTAFTQSLFLSAGTGNITITGDVGTTTALNDVVVTDANNVTFGGGITADTLLQQSGLGTTTIVGAVNTFGAGGIQLTTNSLQFAAGTSSMDSHGHVIILTADAITLPTTFTKAIGSTVTIQTLTAGTSIGLEDATQDLNFTDAQLDTIHSANLVIGSATQTAGISVGGPVSLDENLTLLTAGSISISGALSATTANTILLDAGNDIAVTGSISVLSGDLTLQADDDLTFGAAALVQSASGDVLLLADADGDASGSGGGITMADGAVVNSGTGTLTLLADEDIVIGQLVSSNTTATAISITTQSGGVVDAGDAGGADIILTNGTGVVTITAVTGVGSAAGGGADAALETQVNQLAIANSTSGAVNVDEVDAITILGVEQNGPGSVMLTSGGTMTVAMGGPGVQTQGGSITLVTTGAASNLVLLAPIESRGGDVTITVGGDLSEAVTAPIATSGGQLTVTVGDDATFAGAVSTSGGDFTVMVSGDFAQAGTAPISTAGGDFLATVGGNASFAAVVNTAGGDVGWSVTGSASFTSAGDVITAGGDFAATVGGSVTMADGAVINTALGTISVIAGGDITVGQLVTTNATGSAVLVRSTGGQIVDGGDAGGADIVANSAGAIVTIEAQNGVGSAVGSGSDAALETQIDTLVLRNTTAGNVAIDEADALRILELNQSATGSVTVNTIGNLLLVGGSPGVTATSGAVTLSATGAASSVTIDSKVQTTSGSIAVNAANNVTMGAAAQIVSTSGNVAVTADADGTANGAGGSLFMANGAVINAGSGNVTLQADGNITVGRVITTSTATLISTSGGVVDGGDTGGADITANAVAFQTATGIGSANALETSVNTLAAVNSTSGAIRINNNTGGVLTIGTVGTVTGITNNGSSAALVEVINNGGITVNGAVRNNTGGDIVLTANNSGDLTVNAVIAAQNGNGDVLLTAGKDLILNDTGAAIDISVENGGEVVGVAGGNVVFADNFVVQSETGEVAGVPPILVDVTTPQITALGEATLTLTTQRPLEVGTVIVIDWGDGTIETFVVTEPGTQTLTFTHFYTAPPDPANPAADIPVSVTVLTPGFTTGATTSPTPGTVQVDNGTYVPNIRFAAGGEVLLPDDGQIGTLNQTEFTGVFKTPGEGLASFVFDLTPEVQVLEFPQGSKLDASLLAVPQPPEQTNVLSDLVAAAEDLQSADRVVILEVIGPDGVVLQQVVLSEDVLDDIDAVIRDLPDGRYRFSLREPGESQLRLLQDVEVRQGRISDERDATRDRPPSLKIKPQVEDLGPPADALTPENAPTETSHATEPADSGLSWRTRRAWRQALADEADVPSEAADPGDEIDAPAYAAAGVAAPALLVRPVRSGFSRAARLLRKYRTR